MRSIVLILAPFILASGGCKTSNRNNAAGVKGAASKENSWSCSGYRPSKDPAKSIDFEVTFQDTVSDQKAQVELNKDGPAPFTFNAVVTFQKSTGLRTYTISEVSRDAEKKGKGELDLAGTKLRFIDSLSFEIGEHFPEDGSGHYGPPDVTYPGKLSVTKTNKEVSKFVLGTCRPDIERPNDVD